MNKVFNRYEMVRFAEQLNAVKRERDLRNEAVTRLSLDIEQLQRSETTLKTELRTKNNLLENSRDDFQRQMSIELLRIHQVYRLL